METNAKKQLQEWEKEAKELHGLYFSFCKYLCRWYYTVQPCWAYSKKTKKLIKSKRTRREVDWSKLIGYRAYVRVKSFADKHPEIIEAAVDDDVFAGSGLFFIPHSTGNEYMGETVVYIPQCTNTQNVFFLYPEYTQSIKAAIKRIEGRKNYRRAG